jgi:hypothetical protein
MLSQMYIRLRVNYALFLSDFNETRALSTAFRKILKYQIFMKIALLKYQIFMKVPLLKYKIFMKIPLLKYKIFMKIPLTNIKFS